MKEKRYDGFKEGSVRTLWVGRVPVTSIPIFVGLVRWNKDRDTGVVGYGTDHGCSRNTYNHFTYRYLVYHEEGLINSGLLLFIKLRRFQLVNRVIFVISLVWKIENSSVLCHFLGRHSHRDRQVNCLLEGVPNFMDVLYFEIELYVTVDYDRIG